MFDKMKKKLADRKTAKVAEPKDVSVAIAVRRSSKGKVRRDTFKVIHINLKGKLFADLPTVDRESVIQVLSKKMGNKMRMWPITRDWIIDGLSFKLKDDFHSASVSDAGAIIEWSQC